MRKGLLIPLLISCMGLGACSQSLTINPGKQVEYVDLSENQVSLDVGSSTSITAVTSDNEDVRWANSDQTVVSLSASGNTAVLTGLSKGTANILAMHGGQSAICTVTVGGGNPGQSITLLLSPTSKSININDEFLLEATVSGTTGPVTFTSSDTGVATVETKSNTTAKVKGISEGLATIVAKIGTKTASCSVNVQDPESDVYISLDKQSLTLTEGTVDQLNATVRPSDATINWQSSDNSVCTVSSTGKLTAGTPGNCDISATVEASGTIRTATCHVIVEASGSDDDYDTQISRWSKAGHLYFHYLRKTDADYDKWAIWAWPNYPDDGEGSLWGDRKSVV